MYVTSAVYEYYIICMTLYILWSSVIGPFIKINISNSYCDDMWSLTGLSYVPLIKC